MKLKELTCLMALLAFVCYADDDNPMAKLTFRVTDSLGKPVTTADVGVSFYLWSENPSGAVGKTDTNGTFVVEGACSVDANCSFTKDGYYHTSYRHIFPNPRREPNAVKDGKWQPWNPMVNITLREKRNPIPMYAKNYMLTKIPVWNEPVGYDFEKGEWVKPYGNGNITDMELLYAEDRPDPVESTYKIKLTIRFPGEHNGVYVKKKEISSTFQSEYFVGDDKFKEELDFVIEREKSVLKQKTELNDDEYLIFRVRSKVNEKGDLVSVHYGKIYGLKYAQSRDRYIDFTYYFNPNENDRNLEYDPNENLFDKVKFRGMAP